MVILTLIMILTAVVIIIINNVIDYPPTPPTLFGSLAGIITIFGSIVSSFLWRKPSTLAPYPPGGFKYTGHTARKLCNDRSCIHFISLFE